MPVTVLFLAHHSCRLRVLRVLRVLHGRMHLLRVHDLWWTCLMQLGLMGREASVRRRDLRVILRMPRRVAVEMRCGRARTPVVPVVAATVPRLSTVVVIPV